MPGYHGMKKKMPKKKAAPKKRVMRKVKKGKSY